MGHHQRRDKILRELAAETDGWFGIRDVNIFDRSIVTDFRWLYDNNLIEGQKDGPRWVYKITQKGLDSLKTNPPESPKPERVYGTFEIRDVWDHLESAGEPFYGISGGTARFMEAYNCDLDPDYQRGHVWTIGQQQRFLGHLIEGGFVQPCIINTGPRGDWLYSDPNSAGRSEVIDGKQRITACLLFEQGKTFAELGDGRHVHISDMSQTSMAMLSNTVGLRYKIVCLTRPEALRCYVKLNRGGTVHTDAEITRVQELLNKELTK